MLRWTWADNINFEERWVRLGTRKNKTGEMTYEKLWMNDDLYKLLKWQWDHRHRRQTTTEIYVEGNYTDTKEAIRLLEQSNLEKIS
ncbi:MAG: hypothetical protein WBR24_08025 [Desulfobacterales bacterium]